MRATSFSEETGREGGGVVALYIKTWIECKELSLSNSYGQAESLWVEIRDWTNKGRLVDRVYYKLLD